MQTSANKHFNILSHKVTKRLELKFCHIRDTGSHTCIHLVPRPLTSADLERSNWIPHGFQWSISQKLREIEAWLVCTKRKSYMGNHLKP